MHGCALRLAEWVLSGWVAEDPTLVAVVSLICAAGCAEQHCFEAPLPLPALRCPSS